jgi:integrase
MTDPHQILTDKLIARLPYAEDRQYKVRDVELAGFFVLVGKRKKSFMAQGEFWRDGVREFAVQVKLGEFGDLSTREARSKAKDALGSIARGQKPGESPKISAGSVTLRQENGPYIANGSMRSLRAVYNHARKSNRDLPVVNPVTAIDWNKERRRNTGMGANDIGDWFRELRALQNPLRREFHLLVLLSGSRPTALKRVRIEHIDLRQRLLHIPRPKGGEEKAFDIPLSRPMIRCIIRTIRLGRIVYPENANVWLFPADSENGHLVEHKEERDVLSKWGNELRQSYRTLGQSAGVSELDIHLLMNHSLPGVNAGYITRDKLLRDHLRKQQERISTIVIEKAGERGTECACWLVSGSAETVATEELKQAA